MWKSVKNQLHQKLESRWITRWNLSRTIKGIILNGSVEFAAQRTLLKIRKTILIDLTKSYKWVKLETELNRFFTPPNRGFEIWYSTTTGGN